jgi:hypothetical protein
MIYPLSFAYPEDLYFYIQSNFQSIKIKCLQDLVFIQQSTNIIKYE